jgi:hypothetical protein
MDGHVNHVFLPILLAIWVFALLCYVILLPTDFSDVRVKHSICIELLYRSTRFVTNALYLPSI